MPPAVGERSVTHQLIAQPSFALDGSTSSLARIDQTDVGISSALPLALASSVIPMLRLLTRLAVRSARARDRTRLAAFPCFVSSTGWFRFALYTGSRSFAS